jgi:drug/metabolite transporter (DMT)-like permease
MHSRDAVDSACPACPPQCTVPSSAIRRRGGFMIWGVLMALGAATAWAHNSIVYTFAGRRVGSMTTAHIRMWFALPITLLIQMLILGQLIPAVASPASALASALSGFVGYFVADIFIFQAFLHLGPRDTMLVLTTSPLFSALLSRIVYGESLSPMAGIAALIILGGVALVISDVAPPAPAGSAVSDADANASATGTDADIRREKLIGTVIALGGSLAQAVGIILSKYSLNQGDHPIEVNVIRLSAGLVAFAVFLLVKGSFAEDFRKMADRRALFFIAFGALVGPSLGILGALYAVLFIPVGIAAVLMQTTPVLLLPVERVLFGRKIHLRALLGTLVALGGISLLILA